MNIYRCRYIVPSTSFDKPYISPENLETAIKLYHKAISPAQPTKQGVSISLGKLPLPRKTGLPTAKLTACPVCGSRNFSGCLACEDYLF